MKTASTILDPTGYTYVSTIFLIVCIPQGWEFAHRISELSAGFFDQKWATWAIRSWLLIFSERPERIAHCRSFLVSDLSDLLTPLIWF